METYKPVGIEFVDAQTNRSMMLITEDGDLKNWLAWKHPDGNWVTLRKATDEDHRLIQLAQHGGKSNYSMGCHVTFTKDLSPRRENNDSPKHEFVYHVCRECHRIQHCVVLRGWYVCRICLEDLDQKMCSERADKLFEAIEKERQ